MFFCPLGQKIVDHFCLIRKILSSSNKMDSMCGTIVKYPEKDSKFAILAEK
jgi:hypothetical protein